MKRVTGIGGIFFKANDNKKMYEWYRQHLGIESGEWGGNFKWKDIDSNKVCHTAWSIFKNDTQYLDPGKSDYMINYRVEDLDALIKVLKSEGVEVVGESETHVYGKFAWILDPEGNKIELWEPTADETQHFE